MTTLARLLVPILVAGPLLLATGERASYAQAPESVERVRSRIEALRGGPGGTDRAAAPTSDARRSDVSAPPQATAVTAQDLARLEARLMRRLQTVIDEAFYRDRLRALLQGPEQRRSEDVPTSGETVPRPSVPPDRAPPPFSLPPDTTEQTAGLTPDALDTLEARPKPRPPHPDTVRETRVVEIKRAFLDAGLFRAFEVNFAFGDSTLLPRARRTLDAMGTVLTEYPALQLRIDGHTDAFGPAAFNERLSVRRAQAVRRYLTDEFGVSVDRLVVRGYGETRPIASNDTAAGRELNRRVEFVLLNPAAAVRQLER